MLSEINQTERQILQSNSYTQILKVKVNRQGV